MDADAREEIERASMREERLREEKAQLLERLDALEERVLELEVWRDRHLDIPH